LVPFRRNPDESGRRHIPMPHRHKTIRVIGGASLPATRTKPSPAAPFAGFGNVVFFSKIPGAPSEDRGVAQGPLRGISSFGRGPWIFGAVILGPCCYRFSEIPNHPIATPAREGSDPQSHPIRTAGRFMADWSGWSFMVLLNTLDLSASSSGWGIGGLWRFWPCVQGSGGTPSRRILDFAPGVCPTEVRCSSVRSRRRSLSCGLL